VTQIPDAELAGLMRDLIDMLKHVDHQPPNPSIPTKSGPRDRLQALVALAVVSHSLQCAGARSLALERLAGALSHLDATGNRLPIFAEGPEGPDADTGNERFGSQGGTQVAGDVLAARGRIAAIVDFALEKAFSQKMGEACAWATRVIVRSRAQAFPSLTRRTVERWVHASRPPNEGTSAFSYSAMRRWLNARSETEALSKSDLEAELKEIARTPSAAARHNAR
jgi:hypothetical protein